MREIKTIAVVCNYDLKPDRIGGMDRFFKAYNKALLEEGKSVIWFFSGGEIFEFYEGFILHIAANDNVEELYIDYLKNNKMIDATVTHFVALCTPFYKNIRKHRVKKIIAVDHNPRPLSGFPWKKKIRNRIKGILFSDYIDLFVGVSHYTACHILKDYGNNLASKTVTVYNGVDTSIYLKRTEDNLGKFIIASHLRVSKGIQDLIEAVHLLPFEIQKMIKIDIYGEGPLENDLKDRIKKYNLQKTIKIMGSSPYLHVEFKNYSYLLQPTYMECFSLSILESLAANVPVITTPVGGNLEIITEGINGFLFPPGDIKALQTLLKKIVLKEISIKREVNSEIEENYHLQNMVRNHIDLLKCT